MKRWADDDVQSRQLGKGIRCWLLTFCTSKREASPQYRGEILVEEGGCCSKELFVAAS